MDAVVVRHLVAWALADLELESPTLKQVLLYGALVVALSFLVWVLVAVVTL